MTRRNKTLLLGYGLALAVCAGIAVFDRIVIGLIGAGFSTLVFVLTLFFPGTEASREPTSFPVRAANGLRNDQEIAHRDPGLTNSENIALPVYYDLKRND